MEVLWWGALGMDAERAPLGQGWPVGASPHHSAGAKESLRSRGRTSAQNGFPPLPKQRGSTVRAKPDASSGANIVDTPGSEISKQSSEQRMLPRQMMILSTTKS